MKVLVSNLFPAFDGSIKIQDFRVFYVTCEQATSLIIPLMLLSILMLILCTLFDISSCGLSYLTQSMRCCRWCWQTVYKVLTVTALLVMISYVVYFLYKQRFKNTLNVLYGAIMSLITAVVSVMISLSVANASGIPLDLFSLVFIVWNISISTSFVILHEDIEWARVSNTALLLVSVSASFMLSCLDEVTLWLFVGSVVLWDVFAVYHPMGPINKILRQRQEWIYMGDPLDLPRGLVYVTRYFELGTLDIVMLGVLAGRGAIAATGSPCTFLSGVVAVLVGFMTTCMHSIVKQRTVPALPAAMSIGVIVYILCRVLDIQVMMSSIIEKGLYM
jgi:hypothetical protein